MSRDLPHLPDQGLGKSCAFFKSIVLRLVCILQLETRQPLATARFFYRKQFSILERDCKFALISGLIARDDYDLYQERSYSCNWHSHMIFVQAFPCRVHQLALPEILHGSKLNLEIRWAIVLMYVEIVQCDPVAVVRRAGARELVATAPQTTPKFIL